MTMYNNSFLLVIILVCSILKGTYGQIKCYSCNSYRDGYKGRDCLDPMSRNVGYTLCPRGSVCTKVSYVTQKTFVTSRGCDRDGDTCSTIKNNLRSYYSDLANFKCYTCNKNYCNDNSGATFGISLIAFAFAALARMF